MNRDNDKQSIYGLLEAAAASGYAATVIQAQAASRGNVRDLLLILGASSLVLIGVVRSRRQAELTASTVRRCPPSVRPTKTGTFV